MALTVAGVPMLDLAFVLLLGAATLGSFLALGFLRVHDTVPAIIRALRPHARKLGLFHGGLGAVGLLVLVLALRGAIHPVVGAAGFGRIAAWLFGIGLLVGLLILATARRGRASILVAVHATLAISGIVVLLALVALS